MCQGGCGWSIGLVGFEPRARSFLRGVPAEEAGRSEGARDQTVQRFQGDLHIFKGSSSFKEETEQAIEPQGPSGTQDSGSSLSSLLFFIFAFVLLLFPGGGEGRGERAAE